MVLLCLGLVIFLLPHSLSIFAPAWKQAKSDSLGSLFQGIYSIVSLIGLVLIVYGYSMTRINPVFIWNPPAMMSHISALLLLIAMVLLVATYVPGNRIKSKLGHPMLLSIKIWGFAHLLSNGRLGDIVLFATFMFWAVLLYVTLKRRDRRERMSHANDVTAVTPGAMVPTVITVIAGMALWVFFAVWLHLKLIGVAPFGV